MSLLPRRSLVFNTHSCGCKPSTFGLHPTGCYCYQSIFMVVVKWLIINATPPQSVINNSKWEYRENTWAVDKNNTSCVIKQSEEILLKLQCRAFLHWSSKSQIWTIMLRSKPDVGMFSTRDYSLRPESVPHRPGLPWWKQLRLFMSLKSIL